MGTPQKAGFTIVELLLVIVVIGVLAALVFVGYSNVQKVAADSAIKSDMRNMYDKLNYYKNINGTYPKDNAAELASRGMSLNKNVYDTTNDFNVAYCYNDTSNNYVMTVRSKPGTKFAMGSDTSLREIPASATRDGLSSNADCSDVAAGYVRLYAGYDKNNAYNGYVPGDTYPWRKWVESSAVIDAKNIQ